MRPKQIETLYKHLPENTKTSLVFDGVDPKIGVNIQRLETKRMPIDVIEADYLRNCDTLAGIFDGSINKSENFMEGQARYEGEPVTSAIYLDKSARPVAYLMKKIWKSLSDQKLPDTYFRNIDKLNWRRLMSLDTDNPDAPEVDMISLENYEQHGESGEKLIEHLARIRATFMEHKYLDQVDESNLKESVWQYPTRLDGQRVAIVDEVKSSGATLKIADLLLSAAIPEARFEPIHWSAPGLNKWTIYDREGNPVSREFAAKTVPVWYDQFSSEGRGIGDLDPIIAERSKNKLMRIGRYVISNPPLDASGNRKPMDKKSKEIRQDLDVLADRFLSGQVSNFRFSPDRDDFKSRMESYHGMSLKRWLDSQSRQYRRR